MMMMMRPTRAVPSSISTSIFIHNRLEYLKAVMRGSVDAVSLLHQAGVIHGYVSPSTLLVSTPGASIHIHTYVASDESDS